MEISGAVSGKATWPSDLKPVAWHNGGDMVRMKLGLYHSTNNVADGEVSHSSREARETHVRLSSAYLQWLSLRTTSIDLMEGPSSNSSIPREYIPFTAGGHTYCGQARKWKN